MAAEVALRGLLSSLGVKEPDADLFSYVCTLLVEEEDEDCLETVREMLSSMAPAYASRPDAVQRRAVLDLFEAARSGNGGAQASTSGSGGSGSPDEGASSMHGAAAITAEALVASLRQLELDAAAAAPPPGAGKLGRTASSSGRRPSAPGDAAAAPDSDLENADPQALAALRELSAGTAGDAFLAHVLVSRCRGDAEAAAGWLVENDVAAEEAAWREELLEEAEAEARGERERQKSKAAILERFDLEAVRVPAEGKQKERHVEAWAAGNKQQQPTGKVRYRDGVVVTSNGEKFIIQKPPEFDGGSRGKVYTKGKRGKGFV